jgi:adenosylhomocysteine nucleosidase
VTPVLVLTAVEVEARGLARHLSLDAVAGTGWPHYRSGAIEVACIGLRAAYLSARAGAWRRPALVLVAGACGALAPHLAVGDLVVPDTVRTDTGTEYATATAAPLARGGTMLTVSEAVATAADKARLWLASGAVAVDMESAPILEWAQAQGWRAAVVRGVSDGAGSGVPPALARLVGDDGRVRAAGALRLALTEPARLADAVALGRGTAAALRAVATAVARVARA